MKPEMRTRANFMGEQRIGRRAGVAALTLLMAIPLSPLIIAGPAAADAAYSGHAWIGAQYSESADNGTMDIIQTTISVPTWSPDPADEYYVMLSVYDNAGRYDQIGFSAWGGVWGAAWADLNCDSSGTHYFDYNENAFTLTPGQAYTFQLQIGPNGNVGWSVGNVQSDTIVFSRWATHSGATAFFKESWHNCPGISNRFASFTVYEELYVVEQTPLPWGNFDFTFIAADYDQVADWQFYNNAIGAYPDTPDNQPDPFITVGNDPDNGEVEIWNEWFDLRSGLPRIELEQGTTYFHQDQYWAVGLNPRSPATKSTNCSSACDVTFNIVFPEGWDGEIQTSANTPPYDVSLWLYPPADAALGDYAVDVSAVRQSDYLQLYHMVVTVVPAVSDGGAGGCVEAGTDIRTSTGTVAVEELDQNDLVVGWDFEHVAPIEVAWAGLGPTLEYYGLDINAETLVIPAWGQRVWARTADGEGWIADAIDLHPGDSIFNAGDGRWIEVSSLLPLEPLPFVCDLATNNGNTFVAHGFLLGGYVP